MKRLLVLSAVLIVCGIGILIVLARCGSRNQPAATGRGAPEAAYMTRGRVMMLPSTTNPAAEFQIHHESIESFANPNGTVGVGSVIMPFPIGADSSLNDLAVGDPIEFEFAVWTTPGKRHYEARKIRKLPAETKLNLPE